MGNKGDKGSVFLVQGKQRALAITNKGDKSILKARLIFCVFFSLYFSLSAESYAQVTASRKKVVENKDSIMPFKARWALRTNAVDWVMLLPNMTAEFDLFGSPYKHYTLGLGIKGNWNTSQNYKPYIVYNLFDIRGEFREYFRTSQRSYIRPDSVKVNIFKRMKEDVFTIKRLHPRYWRAYYWGIYADYADYTFKFGRTGIQGTAIGFGVSGGFSIPLYGYRNNSLDLELGASVGGVYTKYDKFERDVESNCYNNIPGKSKAGHLVPFPVINELRVAFVYRFSTSVKNKYRLIDYDKINARQEAKQRRKEVGDSITTARFKAKERKLIQKDSLEREQVKEKEFLILKKDSLEQAKKLEKLSKDSLARALKLEKEEAKKLEKEAKKAKKEETSDSTKVEGVTMPQEETIVPKDEGSEVKKEEVEPAIEEDTEPKKEEATPVNEEGTEPKKEEMEPVKEEVKEQKQEEVEPVMEENTEPKKEEVEPVKEEVKEQKQEEQPVKKDEEQQTNEGGEG